jgi:hypothetical protein
MSTVRINTNNYSGQIANITFSADTGGTTTIGSYVLPHDTMLNYYYGNYDLYFSAFNKTCSFSILDHYLLQEDGFFLLQEDSSFIIIT